MCFVVEKGFEVNWFVVVFCLLFKGGFSDFVDFIFWDLCFVCVEEIEFC